MKKFAKISAVLAALVLALAFAGCSSGDDDDDDGGMKSVSSADDLKLSGTYSYTMKYENKTGADASGYYRHSIEKGTVTIAGTEPDSSVVMIQTYDEMKYTDKAQFEHNKEGWETDGKKDIESGKCKFEFDEENLIIKTTYTDGDEDVLSYSKFKKEYLDPEDYEDEGDDWKDTEKYTGKSLKMADDGSRIVSSYTCISAYTEYGKTESGTSEHTFTLERQ